MWRFSTVAQWGNRQPVPRSLYVLLKSLLSGRWFLDFVLCKIDCVLRIGWGWKMSSAMLHALGDVFENLCYWMLEVYSFLMFILQCEDVVYHCSVLLAWHWMRHGHTVLNFLYSSISYLIELTEHMILILQSGVNPAFRIRLEIDQNVMFWLLLGIAIVVRRAEGSPSPLSAHGGSSDCNVQLVCTAGRR